MLFLFKYDYKSIIKISWILVIVFSIIHAAPSTLNFDTKITDLIESDNLEEALDLYNQLIDKEGDNIDLLNKRGHLYLKLYESENALLDFKKILSINLNEIKGLLGMAKYHSYKFHIVPSLGYLERASLQIENEEDKFQFLSIKGEILMQFNMYDDAEKILFEAVAIQPEDYYLIELFVQSLERQGKDNEVIEYINMVSSENEMTPHTLAKMGQLMNNIQYYSDANLYLEQALNMEPNNPEALCYLAFTYMRLNKTKEALKKIEKSLNENPLNAFGYRVRGEILGKMEKYPKACKDLKRAGSLDVEEHLVEELNDLSTKYCTN